jgi:hypothetical protein
MVCCWNPVSRAGLLIDRVLHAVLVHLAYCGQTEASLHWLKIAIERHYCSFPALDKDPFFDRLRSNPSIAEAAPCGSSLSQ